MTTFDSSLLDAVRRTPHIVVLTGAGVSAESGIPTFRDAMTGLWSKFDPADLATPEAFAREPALVTRWYDERRCQIGQCKPNDGQIALAELQRRTTQRGGRFTIITQNVDRLHQRAGSTDVIELHGTLWVWRCENCGSEVEQLGPAFERYPLHCACGGLQRPGVAWFGEQLPKHALLQAQRASASATLFMSLGTSGVVYPAAGLIDVAKQHGARVLEVNPLVTALSDRADWSVRGSSGAVIPALVAASTPSRPFRESNERDGCVE